MGGRRRLNAVRRAAVVVAIGALAACTSSSLPGKGAMNSTPDFPHSSSPSVGDQPTSSAPTTPPPAPNSTGCPTTYAQPDSHRPKMDLAFSISDDHRTVQGSETISFRPDKPIKELVFRLTANTKPTVQEGNKIVVNSASADHGGGQYTFTSANADPSTQGGLLHIPFADTIPAGTTVKAKTSFTLTLGANSFDRFGRAGDFAYVGSGQPLLAWQRGFGWHDEDLIDFPAESATSEAMSVRLQVKAPAKDTVIMSGDPSEPPAASGVRTWRSSLASARDVSVAAGPFSVSDTTVNGVKLRLGAPSAQIRDQLVPEFTRALTELAKRFGPFPFPSLSVARLPASGGGIEYPSSILMLDGSRLVAVHETAHQWFYAMVGDSQALHPWLDEAFAQYAEELVNQDAPNDGALSAPGNVDSSTESYGTDENGYYFTTYNKGAAALLAAREAAGPAKWDAAVRCYVAANAWRIVVPGDFAHAIRNLPKGVAILRQAGALK